MKQSLFFLIGLLAAASALAQGSRTVMVDSNGVIVAPLNFKTANAPWADLTNFPTVVTNGGVVINGVPLANGTNLVTGVYPTFTIPLGGVWTDFEIKASTNNFATLLFYFKTTGTNAPEDGVVGDPWPKVFFTDSSALDPRQWRTSSNHVSIISQLTHPTAVVAAALFQPSRLTYASGGATNSAADWMSLLNSNLVWSYTRFDGVGFEKDGGGKAIWTPILPTWETTRKSP